jgi:hypothetical protein
MGLDFYPPINFYPAQFVNAGDVIGPAVDLLVLYPCLLFDSYTIDRVSFEITIAPGGLTAVSFGLYDTTKTRVVNAKLTSISAAVKTISISSVTVTAGFYWLGFTQTGAAGTYRLFSTDANIQSFQNASVADFGTGGATTGGDLPASFTTLTSLTTLNVPMVRFWNSSL